ncbi:c-type cytochrome [Alisedimentitalea sp. MJ-SS2]|uniref:c-type cytochrome n=1 Tax=Aliisedimentitalea sp. MJ-SS2 TaxID=3049795 RepID=UPI002906CB84|nr:c-type cytochrome [Alisedimentitalea sp. MJ-SS2]MDU8928108.1 c-type cytochrome [Alisedimentitalea sp. MJ-SS2]
MFDTMTSTKIIGAFCGALLVFLLAKWGAEILYATGGGHGGEQHAAYVIDTGEGDAHAAEEAEEGPSFDELLAAADVAKGAKVFGKCKACHKIEDGVHSTGPSLFGVVNRAIGGTDFGGYSGKLAQAGETWDAATLNAFLTNPKKATPGTSMSFAGLKKEKDRANLIAYLDGLDG